MAKKAVVCLHNGILLGHKKKEILSFVTAWVGLESIMLSEAMLSLKTYTETSEKRNLHRGIIQFNNILCEMFCLWDSKEQCLHFTSGEGDAAERGALVPLLDASLKQQPFGDKVISNSTVGFHNNQLHPELTVLTERERSESGEIFLQLRD